MFISEDGREEEVVTRLARVGYDNSIGFLKGGFQSWKLRNEEIDTLEEIEAEDVPDRFRTAEMNLLDMRKESEFKGQHVKGAENFPLDFINSNLSALYKDKKYYAHCASGYRSVVGASIMKSRGYDNVVNVRDGFNGLSETDLELTDYVEQTTEL